MESINWLDLIKVVGCLVVLIWLVGQRHKFDDYD